MKAWLPVYKFEDAYEINIIDGIVREFVKDNTQSDVIIPNVPIEEKQGDTLKFLGYGVVLRDADNNEQLLPIDKIVVESFLKKPINKPIHHKNGLLIDCCYKNLTLTPPAVPAQNVSATEEGCFYQYKRILVAENGKIIRRYVFDKKYTSYKEFEKLTGLSVDDFNKDGESKDKVIIGIYMWSTRELDFEPLATQPDSLLFQTANA